MKLLQERDGRLRKLSDQLLSVGREDRCFPKCHFFSSFFYNKLYMDRGQYDYTVQHLLLKLQYHFMANV